MTDETKPMPKLASGGRMAKKPPDYLRALSLLVLGLILLAVVFLTHPQNIPLIAQKLCLAALGMNLGYWGDRWIFPYSRPGDYDDFELRWKYEFRRAAIMIGTTIALELGS
jgi:hypothetical protein